MKKSALVFFLVCSLLLCSCSVTISIPVSPIEDFEYEMEDGQIIITKYIGTDLEIRIPESINDRPVTTIGKEAFEEYDMTAVVLPDSVTYIDEYAFSNCVCLEKMYVGKGLKEINRRAFDGCEKLMSLDLPEGLERIGNGAFSRCVALAEISLPDSLTRIEEGAFKGCNSLAEVKLPDGLEYLGTEVFVNCQALTELKIPDNTNPNISVVTQSTYVSVYEQLHLPTASYGALTGAQTGSVAALNLTTLREEVHNQEKPATVLIVSEHSEALRQLRAVESEKYLDLQEEGLYRIEG